MIEYLMNESYGSRLFFTDDVIDSHVPINTHIKRYCMDALFTYEGYLKSVKKKVKERYQIPVYINESMAFIPTRRIKDYENVWINYYAIKDYQQTNQMLEVIFHSGKRLYLKYSLNKLENKIRLLTEIKNIK